MMTRDIYKGFVLTDKQEAIASFAEEYGRRYRHWAVPKPSDSSLSEWFEAGLSRLGFSEDEYSEVHDAITEGITDRLEFAHDAFTYGYQDEDLLINSGQYAAAYNVPSYV